MLMVLMVLMIGTQSSVGMEEEGDGNGLTFKQRLTLAGRQRKMLVLSNAECRAFSCAEDAL
jgi:hypothetical protein